jgi:hypothetical protein
MHGSAGYRYENCAMMMWDGRWVFPLLSRGHETVRAYRIELRPSPEHMWHPTLHRRLIDTATTPYNMDRFAPESNARSREETSGSGQARFTTQAATAEDLLRSQTVGLVNLDDYRKRRAEALDMKERGLNSAPSSGTSTPVDE